MSIPGGGTPTIEEEDEDITTTTESTMPQTTEIENPEATSPSHGQTDQEEPSSGGTTESAEGIALDPHDLMTSSYTEISFDSDSDLDEGTEAEDYLGERDTTPTVLSSTDGSKVAGSLSLPQLASSIVSWSERAKTEYEEEFGVDGSTRPNTAELPSGQYRVEDDGMVSFVADDLEEKLRLSSPTRSVNTSISSGHTEELKSEKVQNEAAMKTGLSALAIQLDGKLLKQLEQQALELSSSIVQMMAHISDSTHSLSKLTVDCTKSYETCLVRTCDSVDANIRSMYYLMSKVEELNKSMKPIGQITEDLNQVKKLLEMFEKAVI